jgi:hypothetical protein
MGNKTKSSDFEFGTLEYYHARVVELEGERNTAIAEAKYYQTELSKAHEILGRTLHQLSERWDTVRLTKYYPTDNLWGKRTLGNPEGK